MPIKFRCKYCNQLMGIARRKAGTDVNCPTCNGVLRVPFHDEPSAPAPPVSAPAPAVAAPPFESSDFDAYLQADVRNQPVVTVPPPQSAGAEMPLPGTVWNPQAAPRLIDVEPAALSPAAPPGIVLSNGLATLLTIAIIFLMALSFSLGLLVGRALCATDVPGRAARRPPAGAANHRRADAAPLAGLTVKGPQP